MCIRDRHKGEALGDAARMDTGSVERRSAPSACSIEPFALGRRWVEPTQRGYDVLARFEQALDGVGVSHQGAVDHTVGFERQQVVDVGGRHHPDRFAPDERPHVCACLAAGMHPASDELQVGVLEDTFDRGLADTTGRPLDHPITHNPSPSR